MSKVKRKVTVENSKENPDQPRRPSVFERLGPGAINVPSQPQDRHGRIDHNEKCRNWLRTGNCAYGNVCKFQHNPFPATSKHPQKPEKESSEKDLRPKTKKPRDEPKPPRQSSPSPKRKERKRSTSRSRKGEHESKIKSTVVVTRPRSPVAPAPAGTATEPTDEKKKKADGSWEDDSDDWPMDAAQLDYKEELTLERKRQQLQRELELELQKERMLNENVTITKTVSFSESSSTSSSSSGSVSSSSDSSSSSSEDDSDSSSTSSSSSSSTSHARAKKKYKKPTTKKEKKESSSAKKSESSVRKKPLDDYDKIKSSRMARAAAAAATTRILSPDSSERSGKKGRNRRGTPSPASSPKYKNAADVSSKSGSYVRKGPRTPSPLPVGRKQRPCNQSSSADSRGDESRRSQKKRHKKKKETGRSDHHQQHDYVPVPPRLSSPNRTALQPPGKQHGKKSWAKHDSTSKSYQRNQSPLGLAKLPLSYSPGNRHGNLSSHSSADRQGKHGKSKNKSKKDNESLLNLRDGGNRDKAFKHSRLSPVKGMRQSSVSPHGDKYDFENMPRKMYSPLSPMVKDNKGKQHSFTQGRHKDRKKMHLEADKRKDGHGVSPQTYERHDSQYRNSESHRLSKKDEPKVKRLLSPDLKKGRDSKNADGGRKDRSIECNVWTDDHKKGPPRPQDSRNRMDQPAPPLRRDRSRDHERDRDRKKGKERDIPPIRDDLERDRQRPVSPLRKGADIHPHHPVREEPPLPVPRGRVYDSEIPPDERDFPYSYGPHREPPTYLDDRIIPRDFEPDILHVPPLYAPPEGADFPPSIYPDPLYRRDGSLKEPSHIERISGYGARGLSPIDPHPVLPRDDDFLDIPLDDRRPFEERWGRGRRDDWDPYCALPPELPPPHVGAGLDEDRYGMPRRRRTGSPDWHMHRDDRELPLRDRRSRSPQHRRGDDGPPQGRGPWRDDRPDRHGNRNNRGDNMQKNQDDRKDRNNYRRDRRDRNKKPDEPSGDQKSGTSKDKTSNKRPHSPSPGKKDAKRRREEPSNDSSTSSEKASSRKSHGDEAKLDSKSSSSKKSIKTEVSSPKPEPSTKAAEKHDVTSDKASSKSSSKQESDDKKKRSNDNKVQVDDFSDWSDGDDDLLNRDDSESISGEKETDSKSQSKVEGHKKEKQHLDTPDSNEGKENTSSSSRRKRDHSRDSRIRTHELKSESRSRTGSKERVSSENSLANKIDVVTQSSKESETSEPYVVKDEAVGEPDDFVTTESVDYDPISDDELEAMIEDPADSPMKTAEENDETKIVDALDINWATLMSDTKSKPEFIPGNARKHFKTAHVLSRIGFSQVFAGAALSEKVIKFCQQQLDEEKAERGDSSAKQEFRMEHQIAAFHVSLAEEKKERQNIFDKVGPARRALCARQDLHIRKFLGRPINKLLVRGSCAQPSGNVDSTDKKLKSIENQPQVVNAAC